MSNKGRQEVILETSVLVNSLKVRRLELLTAHPRYRFTVTDHVRGEITDDYPEQAAMLAEAIDSGGVQEISVTDSVEVAGFATLQGTGRIGVGECSAIAVAANRGLPIAIDDGTARKEARRFKRTIALLNTEAIMVTLIQENVLDLAAADAIKNDWEQNHRFKLPFQSFRERI